MSPAAPMDPDAVPAELAERDQWLLWDNSADTPRRPHWRGNFTISWSDPDDWHSFEEAVEAANEQESWGIGYVTAKDNDDYARGLYGCLDLDGAVYYSEEKGRVTPEDWLPSLQDFIDDGAYIEVSPSGNGLHVWTVGHDAPDWWKDSQFSDDEHRGVEFLTNKFVTVTGDTLQPAYDSVADTDPTDFLFRAYTEIRGENPRLDDADGAASSGGKHRELTEDEITEALDHVDSSCGYSQWRNIGFAVHDWDDGPTGKRVFEQWSRGSGWDDESQRHIDNIWNGAETGSGITVGTLIHHAKEGGWSPSHTNKTPAYPDSHDRRDTDESDDSGDESEPGSGGRDVPTTKRWSGARAFFEDDEKGAGRQKAADTLEKMTHWMYVEDSEQLWVYDEAAGYFEPRGESYAHHTLERELGSHYTTHDANEILARIKARNQTRRKALNAGRRENPLVCVGNGVVDLATGELLNHSPEFKFTRGLPWEYGPNAGPSNPKPVLDFLDDITTRTEDRDTLLDHLAHGLMPGHPYRAFVMTYGPGSNGKTQLGKLFRGFVGEENAASVELQDLTGEDSFATGSLPGAFINVGDDISVGEIRDVSVLKSLTGAGTMRANEKYEKQYEFENEAAMFFSANEPPRIKEKKMAVADRLYPIEMPYRFVNNPSGEFEKTKTPNVAQNMLDDDAAMRGLLQLAVEHAQELEANNGQYSQPEEPAERLERYEAASDPIKRFGLEYLDNSTDGGDVILKADAYTLYTEYCNMAGERPASEDVFKQKVTQLASIDIENTRSRKLSPGDSREYAWAYVRFAEAARSLMPNRLESRYFDRDESSEDSDDDPDGSDESEPETVPYNAASIADAAVSPTGYQTVTVRIADVQVMGDSENAPTKATLVDQTGAIDLISWDDQFNAALAGHEGECVAIKNAELDEYDGATQLVHSAATQLVSIQAGVGYTENDTQAEDDQYSLDDSANADAATDGGESETSPEQSNDTESGDEKYKDTPQAVEKFVRDCEPTTKVTVESVAETVGMAHEAVKDRLTTLQKNGDLLIEMGEGWTVK